MADVKAKTTALVAEIDQEELAVRMIEAMMGIPRPVGLTATQTLGVGDPETAAMALRASETAIRYITECINAGRRPS
jgi:hypothetical protein